MFYGKFQPGVEFNIQEDYVADTNLFITAARAMSQTYHPLEKLV